MNTLSTSLMYVLNKENGFLGYNEDLYVTFIKSCLCSFTF